MDFFLKAGPHLINASGIGTMRAARHPRSVPAHCTPRLTNICRENRGKAAPTADRMIVFAAKTEAALVDLKSASTEEICQVTTKRTIWYTYSVRYESIR